MDYGHELTEGILSDLEADINEIYKEASQTAKEKAAEYTRKFAERDTIMREKLDKGDINEEEYKQWRLGKMTVGARYTAMEEALAEDMTNANKLAASAINGHLPDVYATNYNWATYDIEQNARMDTNFMIYDRQTVERLIRDKPDLLPMKAKIDIPKDLQWNKKQINNAITQGVLLGEGIPDIAKRLANVTDMNRKAAIRNARTMTTSAENGGRIDSYKRATDMGIKITQEWLATKDNRTRHEHAMLDGQEVEVGKPFKVEGYEIMFPADPKAEPFLVYNCRCCLISNFKGFDYAKMDKYVEEKPMSYQEWLDKHEPATVVQKPERPKTVEGWAYSTAKSYKKNKQAIEAINQCVENAPEEARELWEKTAPELQEALKENKGASYFDYSDTKRVYFNAQQVQEGDMYHNPYELHFHEYLHNIDYLHNKDNNAHFYSETWQNKNGDTLEDVIMAEWRKKFGVKRDSKETATAALKYMDIRWQSVSEVKKFMADGLEEWRTTNKLAKTDTAYKAIKGTLGKAKKYEDYQEIYKENADILMTKAIKKRFGYKIEKNDVEEYIERIKSEYSIKERGCLSDIMERFTGEEFMMSAPLGVGHGYIYARDGHNLSIEAFSDIGECCFANKEALELIKKELPETYTTWRQMVKEMVGGKAK